MTLLLHRRPRLLSSGATATFSADAVATPPPPPTRSGGFFIHALLFNGGREVSFLTAFALPLHPLLLLLRLLHLLCKKTIAYYGKTNTLLLTLGGE